MAEKYGVVPKKFTKEWWPYFWMYYKWHTIVAAFVLICVGVTIQQCATSPKYDLTATYVGTSGFSEETQNSVSEYIAQYTADIDGNGKSLPFFQQLVITENNQDAQYNYAMSTKLMLEFQNDCSYLFLMDSTYAENMLKPGSSYDGSFVPVSEWASGGVETDRLYPAEGTAFAVNLKDTNFAKSLNLGDRDIYIAVRCESKDDEKNKQAFDNSKEIANELIKK